jgi:uncharacterized protein (TIGR02996 family)
MAVYLVYRCYYTAPGERQVRKFEARSLLDWFKSIWTPIADPEDSVRHARQLLGGLDVALFRDLFRNIAEAGLARPRNMDQVSAGLVGVEIWEDHAPHYLQVMFEERDLQLAVYLFDDQFRAKAPARTDFLLLDGWELPGTWSEEEAIDLPYCSPVDEPGGDEGALYSVDLFTEGKYNLDDLDGGQRILGLRLPDLARYLLQQPVTIGYGLRSLRLALEALLAAPTGPEAGFKTAIRDNPADPVNWAVFSDWLMDHGKQPAGLHLLEVALRTANVVDPEHRKPERDLLKVTPHLAQACKHEAAFEDRDIYSQWIFFDDRWVAAHPGLAAGLVDFAARWDVLSSGEVDED